MGSIWTIVKLERKLSISSLWRDWLMNTNRVSPFVTSAEGVETQKRLWAELSEILESIQPGVLGNI
jgi:hypothetical protein